MQTKNKGQQAENQACDYLQKQGLHLLMRNYRTAFGEIDLIFKDKNMLVFVEVRARSSSAFGGAVASITRLKQQKILKTAQHYLLKNQLHDKMPIRFDVVGLDGRSGQINWIQHAFGAEALGLV